MTNPIARSGAPVVASTTPLAPSTPAEAPAPLSTPLGPTPTFSASPTGPAEPSSWISAQGAKKAQKGVLALVPGRYPDAVGLPDVLAEAKKSGQAQAAIQKLAGSFQQLTGIAPDAALVAAAVANPADVADLLTATPDQLSKGIDALNAAEDANGVPKLAPKARRLPKKLDLSKADAISIELPAPTLKELAPGLLQGDLPTALPPDRVKSNVIVSELLDRLADNESASKADRFSVKLGAHTHRTVAGFLRALAADHHTIEVTVEHRIANFANLKTKAPDGKILDVPAALMVRTGVLDELGREAVVPATHSELVFHLRSTDQSKGPKVDADVKFYQGISGTGFFACDTVATPNWCGRGVTDTFKGKDAIRAGELAGLLSDLINNVAKDLGLAVGGYGATGVCNDSVAVVQHALTGHTSAYPLLMRDETLAKELAERLTDKDTSDDKSYSLLGN
ncbi:MAG: hypothetical protein HYV07_21045, partial [Deltaproteobacteria bacterium]|nr:hypothetical protein [Deltaproteobacteria bacterium]